ncbi:hypothetical protein [Streptomyces sp. NBC_00878]|uniref:hypothetical protein n=1 Tax=Streptomyces sp. NBC_00878 TaxID=2975854 RepID=UPI00224D508D|nr:hypothetical protein [Streptomyces sp. NBC_00878]MCX4911925.1 hypothetical protein [Streptomyces sp. NBC_00878]
MPNLEITQYDVTGKLGRHLVLDPRSLAYRRRYDGQPLRATAWEPRIPVLNQQNLTSQGIFTSQTHGIEDDVDALGSCTGNAATALLSVILDKDRAAAAGLDTNDATAAERFAIDLYAQATTLDQWHDYTWPSQDCGSSGLGIAKALRARGVVDQYGHATTAEELCMLLQTGPVLMGMPWYEAFTQTRDRDGFIDAVPGWLGSTLEGGHEVCITALEAVASEDGTLLPDHTVLRFRNSWGPSWGDHGEGRLRLSTYLALRDQIDVTQPRLDAAR